MIDVIAGYHLNYLTCGVARFNRNFATSLNVQVEYFEDISFDKQTLLSIKLSEFDKLSLDTLVTWCGDRIGRYDLMLHGLSLSETEAVIIQNARRVFACNNADYQTLKSIRSDGLLRGFCPTHQKSMLSNNSSSGLRILSFGMAHKLFESHYYSLRQKLEESKQNYQIRFSAAVHEGYDFEESFLQMEKKVQNIFGEHGFFLGFLSDDALIQELHQSDFFAAFFREGYRENNTSANTAFASGCCLLTNVDALSPKWLVHGNNFLNLTEATFDNMTSKEFSKIGVLGKKVSEMHISWPKLVSLVLENK